MRGLIRGAPVVALGFVLLAPACAQDDGIVIDLGVIVAADRSEPPIDHPASSPLEVDIPVTVTTYGDDCTWAARTDVEVGGLEAVIRPFDHSATDSVCADTLFAYPHTTMVRFDRRGTATIRLLGYDEGDRFGAVIERSGTIEIQ